MFEINDLTVRVDNKIILDNLSLSIKKSEIHAIMGKNGTGKSTICKTILRDNLYHIDKGIIKYNDIEINNLNTYEISKLGIFLISQNPIEIKGITNAELLRTSMNLNNEKKLSIFEFNQKMESICEKLNLPKSFIHRDINYNMSGGEKKKNELLHLWMLEPSFIILDEIDSGLDVDALKIVANSLKEYYEMFKPSILIITHHKNILEYLEPSYIHVLDNGKIIKTGDKSLSSIIEEKGFTKLD